MSFFSSPLYPLHLSLILKNTTILAYAWSPRAPETQLPEKRWFSSFLLLFSKTTSRAWNVSARLLPKHIEVCGDVLFCVKVPARQTHGVRFSSSLSTLQNAFVDLVWSAWEADKDKKYGERSALRALSFIKSRVWQVLLLLIFFSHKLFWCRVRNHQRILLCLPKEMTDTYHVWSFPLFF